MHYATGAALTQDVHPISYCSRTLNEHEKNYSTIEKKILSIVWAVKYDRPYFFGKEFDLYTDHQPLTWLHKKLGPRLQRWLLSLGEYNINIDYIKGKENKVADFLSRISQENIEAYGLEKGNSKVGINQEFANNVENLGIAKSINGLIKRGESIKINI